jgi:hypothetical protein
LGEPLEAQNRFLNLRPFRFQFSQYFTYIHTKDPPPPFPPPGPGKQPRKTIFQFRYTFRF